MKTNRREFLGAVVTAVGTAACAGTPDVLLPSGEDTPGPSDAERASQRRDRLLEGDALDQAARMRSGEATAVEILEAAIERVEALNGPINAVVTKFYDRALTEAAGAIPQGPFAGVPFLLKDLNDLAGTPKSMGSRLFTGYVSHSSSPHTQAVVDAGFIIMGKTNTPEFGLTATTESAALGICRNPWNRDHSTGGSSGGSAAAVAAGILPMAQASDGGGSIRVPASCCGVFGLKPSRGRNQASPSTRSVDISVQHCVSRSVRDSAAYSLIVQRRDPEAPFESMGYVEGPSSRRLRIAFYTKNAYGTEAHPDVLTAQEKTAALCEELGHEVVPVELDFEGPDFATHFLNLWTSIPAGLLADIRRRGLDPESLLEPVTIGMAERFASAPSNALAAASGFFRGYADRINAHFEDYDLLLSPVLRRPPLRIGEQAGTLPFDEVFDPMIDYVSYTPMFNATGHPAMSVPLGWSSGGLPIGSHFVAGWGNERTLLELAFELEAARPWADLRPPLGRAS